MGRGMGRAGGRAGGAGNAHLVGRLEVPEEVEGDERARGQVLGVADLCVRGGRRPSRAGGGLTSVPSID